MKKFLIFFIAFITAFSVANNSTAQSTDKTDLATISTSKPNSNIFISESGGDYAYSPVKSTTKASKANLKALKANYKATENFKKEFKDVTNVKWSVNEETIVGFFDRDEVKTHVVYDRRGSLMRSLKYADEKKTPAAICSLVRNAYAGYKITLSVEVTERNATFYIVQIENETTLKQLGVYNQQINEIQEMPLAKS